MGRKRQKAALITAAVAGVLALALVIAGTLLRMNTRGMDFWNALSSFLSDTFQAGV